MKVCFLTGEYPPMQGGVADHTAHLARHLVELGIEVSILTSSKAASATETQLSNRKLSNVHPVVTGWGLGCWRQIGRFLGEHRPDVLHIQYQAVAFDLGGWINWLPWWLRRRSDRPRLVVTFHDLRVPYLFPKAGRLRWRSILALARHSDAVVVTNVEDEQTLQEIFASQRTGDSADQRGSHSEVDSPIRGFADSVTLIPLGSNVEPQPPADYDRRRWRSSLGVDDKDLLLAYFGFLNESKGGEDLVLALAELIRRGYETRLLMVGGQVGDVDPTNRAYADRVQALIQAHGLMERVHWTGYTSSEEVSANLLATDVVVMPYRDGVSFRRTTFIAALGHGRPVVTTHPVVALTGLRDGENVLLVPPRDVDALVDAVARLSDNSALRARLAAGAEALARQFRWPAIARQTTAVYEGLLS